MADIFFPHILKRKCDLVCHLWQTLNTSTKICPMASWFWVFQALWAFPLRSGFADASQILFCNSHLKFIYPWLKPCDGRNSGSYRFLSLSLSIFLQSSSTQGYTEQITKLASVKIPTLRLILLFYPCHVKRVPQDNKELKPRSVSKEILEWFIGKDWCWKPEFLLALTTCCKELTHWEKTQC